MVIDSILPHAEFGRNYQLEDAPHFTLEQRKRVLDDISSYDKGRLLNGAAGAEKNRDCNLV